MVGSFIRRGWLGFLLLLAVPLAAGAAQADYGALATGPNGAYGWSNDARSAREAARDALGECGRGCRVQVEFHNTCAAYATGRGGAFGWERHADRRVAQERAVRNCRKNGDNCRVKVWACN